MGDKGDSSKKQPQQQQHHHHHPKQQQQISSSPKSVPEEAPITEQIRPILHQQQQQSPFISSPLYVSGGATSSPFEQQQQFETLNTKRPRYSSSSSGGQWKQLLPSPTQQKQSILPTESTPSPSTNPPPPQPLQTYAASSSDTTASSPSHSPMPMLSGGSGQEGSKPEGEPHHQIHQQQQQQLRKGKYVSPVWKPNEMLWLARAWKAQYQGSGGGSEQQGGGGGEMGGMSRGKTRADKDREVAEFLQRHGVNRDAKTAGTKWDNMLGEFRKVYEWERGGEREHVGKSYFRLSPYERKLHRLPASFDEEVFEELSHFMGSRMRSSHARTASTFLPPPPPPHGDVAAALRALPPPPRPFKDDDLPLSARTKQLGVTSGGEAFFQQGARGNLLGLESLLDIQGPSSSSSLASSSREVRRIGKIRMTWEESVSLWAEEGEVHRGRVRVQASSFLNADELTFFDESMVPCPMECFEDGPLRGFSVDRFVSGQHLKVFGRRKSPSATSTLDFRDPTDYYLGCLRQSSPQSLPTLFELKRHLQEPPPEDLRFPLRKEVYDDLPLGKELFFTTTEQLDSRNIMYDIVGPIIRSNPSLTSTTRESFIPLWDDCINRIVSKFCPEQMVLARKPTLTSSDNSAAAMLQDQWPNVAGFVNNFCLWRGEETDQVREGQPDPSSTIVNKVLWTYTELPYILGYHAVGTKVTICALARSQQDAITRTDLQELNLSTPSDRIRALVTCFRIGTLLPVLSRILVTMNSCSIGKGVLAYSDFERVESGNGVVTEMTPSTCTRVFWEKRKWLAVKEVYEILKHRIPHAEFLVRSCEREMRLVFKPRGCRMKPSNCEQLVEALKYVTKALVALHDLSFMHRDLGWEKVMRRSDRDNEWFVCGFDEAAGAPELNRHVGAREGGGGGGHAPEMERGLHGVKVDVWGVGNLIRTCGLGGGSVPKMLRELQRMCMEHNPEHRPTAADCYHHLLQLQSSLSPAAAAPSAAAAAASDLM